VARRKREKGRSIGIEEELKKVKKKRCSYREIERERQKGKR
jgi:hypothetical protein